MLDLMNMNNAMQSEEVRGVETHSCAEVEDRGRWDRTRTRTREMGGRREEESDTARRLDGWRSEGLESLRSEDEQVAPASAAFQRRRRVA